MLVPTLACPAACGYCFQPRVDGDTMSRATLEAVVTWQQTPWRSGDAGADENLEITFHGGEPLVVGEEWYRTALPLLRDAFPSTRVRFSIQSNLWFLSEGLCDLFREYDVSVGTSLDGPREINDAQRGTGYFDRTMAGIDLARRSGLDVGVICTFTSASAGRADEVFDFFVDHGLGFSVHAALPSLQPKHAEPLALDPAGHAELLVALFERYLSSRTTIRIGTLNAMARGLSAGSGGACTFVDCLGHHLAVGPDGAIYPCQRFAGLSDFAVGSVHARPCIDESRSPAWRAFAAWEARTGDICSGCVYVDVCRGGCPYNALAAGCQLDQLANGRDPHCPAYRRAFGFITERAMDEVFSSENLEAVVESPDASLGLLRHGRMLSIMHEMPGDGTRAVATASPSATDA
jgi:uncharacterized protein